ncbi:hypothetical protein BDN70DRAFT_550649 [Pholiota conissans]|uniref:Uncharacterized protein n=1 Tax=Pholiota conissans TaxID=109636 RepID=A0A9P6CMF1_9AGAR|nr:hypothetical protein BDN70DRAFT_550649 [Pholiota conissans]
MCMSFRPCMRIHKHALNPHDRGEIRVYTFITLPHYSFVNVCSPSNRICPHSAMEHTSSHLHSHLHYSYSSPRALIINTTALTTGSISLQARQAHHRHRGSRYSSSVRYSPLFCMGNLFFVLFLSLLICPHFVVSSHLPSLTITTNHSSPNSPAGHSLFLINLLTLIVRKSR